MDPSDPSKASDGTLRKLFASNVRVYAVNGSDTPETATQEINFS